MVVIVLFDLLPLDGAYTELLEPKHQKSQKMLMCHKKKVLEEFIFKICLLLRCPVHYFFLNRFEKNIFFSMALPVMLKSFMIAPTLGQNISNILSKTYWFLWNCHCIDIEITKFNQTVRTKKKVTNPFLHLSMSTTTNESNDLYT